jgi:hypothetical protein
VIGIGKSEPSARRSVSTQLKEGGKAGNQFQPTRSLCDNKRGAPEKGAPLVVLLAHEALERRETAVHDEFEVAELTFSEANVGNLLRLLQELGADGRIAGVQVLEDSSVGCVESLQVRQGARCRTRCKGDSVIRNFERRKTCDGSGAAALAAELGRDACASARTDHCASYLSGRDEAEAGCKPTRTAVGTQWRDERRAIAAEIRLLPPLGSPREGFSRQFSVNCYSRDAYSFESRDWLW